MERIWYYAQGSDRKGPLTTTEITALLSSGALSAQSLVWSEGMATWQPASATELAGAAVAPSAPPPPAPTPTPISPRAIASAPGGVPAGLRGWMQFCGVMLIIMGAMQCLTCIGIVYGLPVLLAGIGFTGAAATIGDSATTWNQEAFLAKLHSGFKSMGVAILISLVMILLLMGLYATIGLALLRSVQHALPELPN